MTSKWRHKFVKLRHSLKYSDYFIMWYLNAVFCANSEIKNWNTNVKVLNNHEAIITSKWRHNVVKLRHSLKYRDYFIRWYLNVVFGTDSEIQNWNTNVKVLNNNGVIITSKLRHKAVKLRYSLKQNDYLIMTYLNPFFCIVSINKNWKEYACKGLKLPWRH